jgi:hypothetical protein
MYGVLNIMALSPCDKLIFSTHTWFTARYDLSLSYHTTTTLYHTRKDPPLRSTNFGLSEFYNWGGAIF